MEHMIKSMYLVTGNCSQKILSKNENKKYPELLVKFRVSHFLGGKLSVAVPTYVSSNRILPMLRIPNRQNPQPELYHTEFSVQKIPTCKQ